MSTESTINELQTTEAWESKLAIEFLQSPASEQLSDWIDSRLAGLEDQWLHASSPKALRGSQGRIAGRRSR